MYGTEKNDHSGLVLYTDGLSKATLNSAEEFGEEPILQTISSTGTSSGDEERRSARAEVA